VLFDRDHAEKNRDTFSRGRKMHLFMYVNEIVNMVFIWTIDSLFMLGILTCVVLLVDINNIQWHGLNRHIRIGFPETRIWV
jgi:hypothetical protein